MIKSLGAIFKGVYYYAYYECYKMVESWYKDPELKGFYGSYTLYFFMSLLYTLPSIYLYRKITRNVEFLNELSYNKWFYLFFAIVLFIVFSKTVEKNVEKRREEFYSNPLRIRFLRRVTLLILLLSVLLNVLILYSMYQG